MDARTKRKLCKLGISYDEDKDDEGVCCDEEVIDEYLERYHNGWLTEAEMRMLLEKAKRGRRARKIEYRTLQIITILLLCGVAYYIWAVVTASGNSPWENILYGITCLFCFIIGLLTLHYNRQ